MVGVCIASFPIAGRQCIRRRNYVRLPAGRMNQIEIFVALLIVVAALAIVAKRIALPYPVLLVIAGLALGFVHGPPPLKLDPEMVLLLVLPPLLYPAALFTSWRDFRANLNPIL